MNPLWIVLGLLVLSGGPKPEPQDFGPPATVEVELVSLKLQPDEGFSREAVYGYLGLTPVVPDDPARPVEALGGFGAYGYLPGRGLAPEPFAFPADGRWHRPDLKRTAAVRWGAVASFTTVLRVYPLVREVGSRPKGSAGVDVALFLEGIGWVKPAQRRWVAILPSRAGEEVSFDTPYGQLSGYLRFRERPEWVYRSRREATLEGHERAALYRCPPGAPEWDFDPCVFEGYDP